MSGKKYLLNGDSDRLIRECYDSRTGTISVANGRLLTLELVTAEEFHKSIAGLYVAPQPEPSVTFGGHREWWLDRSVRRVNYNRISAWSPAPWLCLTPRIAMKLCVAVEMPLL